ncbi:MAG: hypothetical protein JWO06_1249 [Bacteroidota bacterium]|nr:hypothetical protein [Bacteroidota bacterium]
MKKSLTLFALLLSLSTIKLFAANAQDSLILLDGKIITGTIEEKSLEVFDNMQANINTWYTLIDQADGKPMKVQNKEINYFIISGVRYANRKMPLGNKFMRVVEEGKANLYFWFGTATVSHMQHDHSNPSFDVQTLVSNSHELSTFVLYIDGKPYTPNAKYLKKQFSNFFGDCPKLVEESTKDGFNFDDLVGVVKKYNACVGGGTSKTGASKAGH